ncbi:MAG: hypothetical protein ACXVIK_05390 [Halobacteriota archaeon]
MRSGSTCWKPDEKKIFKKVSETTLVQDIDGAAAHHTGEGAKT